MAQVAHSKKTNMKYGKSTFCCMTWKILLAIKQACALPPQIGKTQRNME